MIREFTDEYEVTFFETDTKNRLSPGYMLALFQDTAVNQFEDSPYTIEYLLEK